MAIIYLSAIWKLNKQAKYHNGILAVLFEREDQFQITYFLLSKFYGVESC